MRLTDLSLVELKRRLDGGEVSPREAVRAHLEAIERLDGRLGAFLHVFGERALERAAALEARGDLASLPLGGVPIAVKDNMCTAGRPTTCASRILEGYEPPYDATVVRRLEEAGAILVGKTNLDEFAMGSSTEYSYAGPTRNPWDPERSPGGSSGGSAVAVAARMVPGAFGSDTGGSIRQPAALTGIVGMKPTYGRVSRYGLVAFASSLDQIGPFTRSVEDMAHLLPVVCGFDERDSTSSREPVPDLAAALTEDLSGVTFGVPHGLLGDLSSEVRESFEGTLASARAAGARVREIELPHARYAIACYYVVANAEASSNLARYDGVRYGVRGEGITDLASMYERTREAGFGDEVKRRILLGTFVLSAGYYDAYYLKAQKVRTLILNDFLAAFDSCDLVLLPTSPTAAFRLGEKSKDPLTMYLSDVFTTPGSLAGLPGISIPSGLTAGGLPLGAQILGPAFREDLVLRGAHGLERALGFTARPDLEALANGNGSGRRGV